MHVTDVHFNPDAVTRNSYGFLTVNWELTLFQWIDPDYLPQLVESGAGEVPRHSEAHPW